MSQNTPFMRSVPSLRRALLAHRGHLPLPTQIVVKSCLATYREEQEERETKQPRHRRTSPDQIARGKQIVRAPLVLRHPLPSPLIPSPPPVSELRLVRGNTVAPRAFPKGRLPCTYIGTARLDSRGVVPPCQWNGCAIFGAKTTATKPGGRPRKRARRSLSGVSAETPRLSALPARHLFASKWLNHQLHVWRKQVPSGYQVRQGVSRRMDTPDKVKELAPVLARGLVARGVLVIGSERGARSRESARGGIACE